MFDAGLHIQDHHFVPGQDQMGDQALQHDAFRADAAAAAPFDPAHDHDPDIPFLNRELFRQVAHVGVQFKERPHGTHLGFGPLLDQFLHLRNGDDVLRVLDPQGAGQIGVRVGINGQDLVPPVG